MTTRIVNLKDLGKEIKNFAESAVEEQKKAITRGLTRSLPMLAAASPVDTGQYAASWDMTVDEQKATIGNYAPHAPIIEYGARPFTPPLGPLLSWAKRVLQDPGQPPNYSPKVWALARGTQRKIAREGMKPRFVLTNALPDIIRNIEAEFRGMK